VLQRLGEAQVRQLDLEFIVDEDVSEFDIAVRDVPFGEVVNRFDELDC